MAGDWQNLDLKGRIMVVTEDIMELLDKLQDLTAPEGEVDSAVQKASESFEPLIEFLRINKKDETNTSVILEEEEMENSSDSISSTDQIAQIRKISQKLNESKFVKSKASEDRVTRKSGKKLLSESSGESESSSNNPQISTNPPKSRKRNSERLSRSGQKKEYLTRSAQKRTLGTGEERLVELLESDKDSESSVDTVIYEGELPAHSFVDPNEPGPSGLQTSKKSSGTTRKPSSTSVYESYTHYNPEEWETDSDDELENDPKTHSTIY